MKHHKTWWGESFVLALEGFIDPGRLTRGRAYRTDNRILEFHQNDNHVQATIRGNINPYFGVDEEPRYQVDIKFNAISKIQWQDAIQQISNNASWLSKLMLNEIPDNIDDAFSSTDYLLPKSYDDVDASCSCPDWDNPCKHIAGVYYRIANILDSDPMLLFSLRGISSDQLILELKQTELGSAFSEFLSSPEETHVVLEDRYYPKITDLQQKTLTSQTSFWEMGTTNEVDTEPAYENKVVAALVKKQGDFPPFWNRHNSFIVFMESFYDLVRRKNKKII
ncbi:MAG: SWIM zinc finger family protein [Legionellaceae bacterium]|nr:SWIM zinc finger family protein [Legionellaceae bacterium]